MRSNLEFKERQFFQRDATRAAVPGTLRKIPGHGDRLTKPERCRRTSRQGRKGRKGKGQAVIFAQEF